MLSSELIADVQPRDMDATSLLRVARTIGSLSKDRSTKVGCLLLDRAGTGVLSMGWNAFPDGVNDNIPERWQRPSKYCYVTHAEINAIAKAARNGVRLDGATCIITLFPCADCAKALIQSGIRRIVTTRPNVDDPKWGEDWRCASELLKEANVELNIQEPH